MHSGATSTTNTTSPTPVLPSSWDIPQNASDMLPDSDTDRLAGGDGYFVWAIRMRNAFECCGLLNIVEGRIAKPSPGDTTEAVWKKMNENAWAFIIHCIADNLVMRISHLHDAKEVWDFLAEEYSQASSSSVVDWFSRLTRRMPPGGSVSDHIARFQKAVCYLANVGFVLPESTAAAILLSTLPSDTGDPESWGHFIKGIKLSKTTTLSTVVTQILEEKRWRAAMTSILRSTETTLTALERDTRAAGKKWCRNCKCDGHDWFDCWAPGGGKEGQGPKWKQKRARKKCT